MKLLKSVAAILCAVGLSASASTSNMTATATDTDGTVWSNCVYTATITILGQTSTPPPTIGGVTVSPLVVKGSCSASGVMTPTLTDTSSVDQKNVQWVFKVQSNTSAHPVTVSVPVVGASPNLTNSFSLLEHPRFATGANAYGYADIEVQGLPQIGSTYYNVTTPCLRQFSLAGWTCGGGGGGTLSSLGFVAGVAGPNYYFGDSTTAPIGSGDSGSSLQMANRLSNDMLGQKFVYAIAGTITPTIQAAVFADFPVNYNTTSNLPKVWVDAGINDANTQTASIGVINNYSLEYNAMISWLTVPTLNKVYATQATAAGTWVTSNTFILHSSNAAFGGEKNSTTSGSTLTFAIPAGGTRSGIYYGVPFAANGGTFTYSIDGVLQTDVCSGTTTFSNTGCNSAAMTGNSIFRQDFPVTVGTHTGVLTVTSATSASNTVYVLGVDVTPTTLVGQPTVMASGVIMQNANANAANTLAFDQAQAAVMASLSSWSNSYRVDVRGGTPGVNSATDMAVNTSGCVGGVSPLHPNSCGYQHWVQTVENTAAAAGLNIFFPGLGVNPSTFNTSTTTQGTITSGIAAPAIGDALGAFIVATQAAGTSVNAATPNILNNAIPSATLFGQLACFFPTLTNTACTGLTYDAVRAQLAMGLVSQYEMGFQHCAAALTGGPTGCRWDLFTDPVAGGVTIPIGLVMPEIKATTGTRFVCVDTAGNITSSASACVGT